MNDAALVRGLDGGAICGPISSVSRIESGRATSRCARRLAVDELERQVGRAARLLEPVDRRRCWVGERGEQLGLALEAREPLGICGEKPTAAT
jgi:hypothetical protein